MDFQKVFAPTGVSDARPIPRGRTQAPAHTTEMHPDEVHGSVESTASCADQQMLAALHTPLIHLPIELQEQVLDPVRLSQWEDRVNSVDDPVRRAEIFGGSPKIADRRARFAKVCDVAATSPSSLAMALEIRKALVIMPRDAQNVELNRLLSLTEQKLRGDEHSSFAIEAMTQAVRTPDQFDRLYLLACDIGNGLSKANALAALTRVASAERIQSLRAQVMLLPFKVQRNVVRNAIILRERELGQPA